MGTFAPFQGELAKSILLERYFMKDESGVPVETWESLCRRVANTVAAVEDGNDRFVWEKGFFDLMYTGDFLPNSPTLMNAGLDRGLLSACFVLPVEDNMESIFETLLHTALVQKAGGGTGFSFSQLRPEKAKVGKHGGTSSGVVSFISVYDQAGEVIKQGGRRRAANMGILRVDHPEILKFIRAKERDGVLSNFNLSVAITDDFVRMVLEAPHEPMQCHHPSTGFCVLDQGGNWHTLGADLGPFTPPGPEISECVTYGQLFGLICEKAWANGEPGIFFIDTANKDNPAPEIGGIEATNPCGEQPLLPYESCNLGSINLANMVPEGGGIDWNKLAETVRIAVRFLDNVIDANYYPIPQIEEMTKRLRPIGLGVMGFADILLKLGITYGSPHSISMAQNIAAFINDAAHAASKLLGEIKGGYKPDGPRNSQVTTVAPTGTVSIIAGCSSGIEPIFKWIFKRRAMEGEYIEAHPLYKPYHDGPQSGNELPEYFVTADQVPWNAHIDIQAAFQKHTDAGISKTINLPTDAKVQDVMAAILYAHEKGCKGITVYRDNSRANQVIDKVEDKKEAEKDERSDADAGVVSLPRGVVAPRPEVTFGMTKRYKVACGKLYVTYNADLNSDDHCEIFVQSSESGGCQANTKALGMMVSMALRCGMKPEKVIKTLRKVACPACRGKKGLDAKSCPDAVARAMMELELSDGNVISIESEEDKFVERLKECSRKVAEMPEWKQTLLGGRPSKGCPECGEPMNMESGCWVCRECGYSKCG